jgi:hypothetical protein
VRGPDGLFVWGQHDESHALLEVSCNLWYNRLQFLMFLMYRTYLTISIAGLQATKWRRSSPMLHHAAVHHKL